MLKPIASVKISTGRMYLDVRGVAVAMEGDPCRDIKWASNRWTEEMLNEAAHMINNTAAHDNDPSEYSAGL
jgi:hypothetical protein